MHSTANNFQMRKVFSRRERRNAANNLHGIYMRINIELWDSEGWQWYTGLLHDTMVHDECYAEKCSFYPSNRKKPLENIYSTVIRWGDNKNVSYTFEWRQRNALFPEYTDTRYTRKTMVSTGTAACPVAVVHLFHHILFYDRTYFGLCVIYRWMSNAHSSESPGN